MERTICPPSKEENEFQRQLEEKGGWPDAIYSITTGCYYGLFAVIGYVGRAASPSSRIIPVGKGLYSTGQAIRPTSVCGLFLQALFFAIPRG